MDNKSESSNNFTPRQTDPGEKQKSKTTLTSDWDIFIKLNEIQSSPEPLQIPCNQDFCKKSNLGASKSEAEEDHQIDQNHQIPPKSVSDEYIELEARHNLLEIIAKANCLSTDEDERESSKNETFLLGTTGGNQQFWATKGIRGSNELSEADTHHHQEEVVVDPNDDEVDTAKTQQEEYCDFLYYGDHDTDNEEEFDESDDDTHVDDASENEDEDEGYYSDSSNESERPSSPPSIKKSFSTLERKITPNSDQAIKEALYQRNLSYFDKKCSCGNSCYDVARENFSFIFERIREFWGPQNSPQCPTRTDRVLKILPELRNAYCGTTGKFTFSLVGRNNSINADKSMVCELCYADVMGFVIKDSRSISSIKPSKTWMNCRNGIVKGGIQCKEGLDQWNKNNSSKVMKSAKKSTVKLAHALSYIHEVVTQSADATAYSGYENLCILPYDHASEFYGEYVHDCQLKNISPACQATFRRAARKFSESNPKGIKMRYARCKGHFQTCEICTKASDMFKNTSLNSIQRKIMADVKRLHLKQQSQERELLEINHRAAKEKDARGQPKMALLFSDGMTIYTTNTPKLSKVNSKESVKTIESRIIGVEVICGDIDTIFLYYTDDMVSGGAAIMIEVQRKAMEDLRKLLSITGQSMPKKVVFQFDNCGENKNKYMMGYLSLLVEAKYFDEIDMNYLIVGHTHSTIDQFFSSLSKIIKQSCFIGSPKALFALLKKEAPPDRISIIKQIEVQFDFPSSITPFLNQGIKYFQIPHCFKFTRIYDSKCIMQYKLFSSNDEWLPKMPENIVLTLPEDITGDAADLSSRNQQFLVIEAVLSDKLIEIVPLPSNAMLGGDKAIHAVLNVEEDLKLLKASKEQQIMVQTLQGNNGSNGYLQEIRNNLAQAAKDQIVRMLNEENGNLNGKNRREFSIVMEDAIRAASNPKEGYISWLKSRIIVKQKRSSHSVGGGERVELTECDDQQQQQELWVWDIQPRKLSPKGLIDKLVAKEQEKLLPTENANVLEQVPLNLPGNANFFEKQVGEAVSKETTSSSSSNSTKEKANVVIDGTDHPSSVEQQLSAQEFSGTAETIRSIIVMESSSKKRKIDESTSNLIDGMQLSQQEKTMYNGAKSIAAAASAVLQMKDNSLAVYFKERPDGLDQFDYSNSKMICKSEVEFYSARNTPLKVLQLLQAQCDKAEEWKVLPEVILTPEAIARKADREAGARAQLEAAIQQSKAIIKPAHDNTDPTRESIQRPGLTTVMTAAAAAAASVGGKASGKKKRKQANDQQQQQSARGVSKSQKTKTATTVGATITTNLQVPVTSVEKVCNIAECNAKAAQCCDKCKEDCIIKYCVIHFQHERHRYEELRDPCPKRVEEKAESDARDLAEYEEAVAAAQRREMAAASVPTIEAMKHDSDRAESSINEQEDAFEGGIHSVNLAGALYATAYNAIVLRTKGTDLKPDLLGAMDYPVYNGDVLRDIIEQIYFLTDEHAPQLHSTLQAYLESPRKHKVKGELRRLIVEAIVQKYNLREVV